MHIFEHRSTLYYSLYKEMGIEKYCFYNMYQDIVETERLRDIVSTM